MRLNLSRREMICDADIYPTSVIIRGDSRGALALILSDPPYGEANTEAKVRNN